MRNLGLLLLLLTGCTRALQIASPDGGGSGCDQWKDAASCSADPSCTSLGCPQCDGGNSFLGCYDKNGPLPRIGCPAAACVSCQAFDEATCRASANRCVTADCCGFFQGCFNQGDPLPGCAADCVNVCAGLDEASCKAHPGCRADYCPGCNGSVGFGCRDASTPPPECPAPPPCPPPPPPCNQLSAEAACDARPDCHSVFTPAACACAFCCCTPYSRCADGAPNCHGPALCNSAPPDCGEPACNGQFAVGYTNSCYEGCVLASACGP